MSAQPTAASPATGKVLELDNVHTYYGSIHALKGITIDVGEQEIVTLLGANGAGKSTTLRSINGLNHPRRGTIHFQGNDITNASPHSIVSRGVAQSPEGRRLFPRMTVFENLEMGAFQRTDKSAMGDDIDRVYDLFPLLHERRSQLAGTLSGGEQQMVAMGRALMSRPKLLLMDEPSMGLAPILVERNFEIIKQVHESGVAMLIVEQNANVSLSIADRGYVLSTGRLVLEGRAEDLRENAELRKAYLGR